MKSVYIDKDEIREFWDSGIPVAQGVSYEWEGEGVAHLHLHPLQHSFGSQQTMYWHRADMVSNDEALGFFVKVNSAENAEAGYVSKGIAEPCKVNYIPSKDEVFSRSKGILEVDVLKDKRVMIVGLGSFGSQIAIELAKAGVGSFSLFDFDRVELHNLARHTCGMKDLGRLKTDAIKEAILGKNKLAQVDLFPFDINKHREEADAEVQRADLVICATDNNHSRFSLSESLIRYGKVAIFGRAVTRAEGGDVFRYRPGGPCYNCLVGAAAFSTAQEEVTDRSQLPAYVSQEEADAIVQVGLSSDIEPICNLMVKLALIELARGEKSGIEPLEEELVYDYYIWANRRERRHASWSPFNAAAQKPTILRWYGARIVRDDHCPVCSAKGCLDTGDDALGFDMQGLENVVLDTD